jgi:hypothetical protein
MPAKTAATLAMNKGLCSGSYATMLCLLVHTRLEKAGVSRPYTRERFRLDAKRGSDGRGVDTFSRC